MTIDYLSICFRDSPTTKTFAFNSSTVFLYSNKNSVGKTTFLRSILYCLGFSIPSTKKVNFDDYVFECGMTDDNGEKIAIKRDRNVVLINGVEYNHKTDYLSILGHVFSLDNIDLLNNYLAAIYIDQEKGWTLLNRGKIIGSNSFNIESFLRGLNDRDVAELVSALNRVEEEIERYSLLLNVADYQKKLTEHNEELSFIEFDEVSQAEIGLIQNQIDNLDKEIRLLSGIKKQNTDFVDYISRLGLQIEIDGKTYTISKKNLLNFNDIQLINGIRLSQLRKRKNELISRKAVLFERLQPKELVSTETVLEAFDNAISKHKIDALKVKSILDSLSLERERIKDTINRETQKNNPWVDKLNVYILQYWNEMGIEIPYKTSFLFTRDLKSLSGALLYKTIIVFRLAYMKALFEKTHCFFPIFIDSPSGREVEESIVRMALKILKRDFASHQIFISSIKMFPSVFDYESSTTLIFDNLGAFNSPSMFDGM